MGFWKSGIDRSATGEIRTEDDLTNQIKEFFESQEQVEKYDIVDVKNWVVDVEGSILLFESDLADGELFFKIGKLTGNLYCHCRYFKPSVIPTELGGEIVFVLDEEELAKYRTNTIGRTNDDEFLGMHARTTKIPTVPEIRMGIEDALSDYVNNGCTFDINEIIRRIADDMKNRSRYKLRMEATKPGNRDIECEFYVADNDTPLRLTAIQKAVYIVFILHKEGLYLTDRPSFKAEVGKIYSQIAGRVEDVNNGVLAGHFSIDALNSCRSNIRTAIKEKICNSQIVDDFAIEGYVGKPFFVTAATDKLRKQIRSIFVLN